MTKLENTINKTMLVIGSWQIDPNALCLTKGEQQVKVQPKVMELLLYLANRPNQVVLREELIENIWSETSATDDTLNNTVGKLRRVLVADGKCETYIQTIPKKGYCLKAPVNNVSQQSQKITNLGQRSIFILVTAVVIFGYFIFGYNSTEESSNRDFSDPTREVAITSHQDLELFPALSPDNTQMTFIRVAPDMQKNKLIIKQLESGTERELNDINGLYGNPRWSPDGKRIAFIHMAGETCTIRIVNSQGGPSRFISECSGTLVRTLRTSLAWMPDGKHLIVAKNQAENSSLALFKVDINSGHTSQLTFPKNMVIGDSNQAVSLDGKQLAFTRTDDVTGDHIVVLNLSNQNEIKYAHEQAFIQGIDWIDEGALLFSSSANHRSEIRMLDLDNGIEHRRVASGRGAIHLDYAAGSKQLTYAELNSNANVVIRKRINQNDATIIDELKSSKWEREAVFSPDGKLVAYIRTSINGAELWLYDLKLKSERRLVEVNDQFLTQISWSRDNQKIAVQVKDQVSANIHIYDIERDHFYQFLADGDNIQTKAAWLPDSKGLVFTSKSQGNWEIYQASLDGSNIQLLTDNGGDHIELNDSGDVVYFSRANEPGLWQLSLNATHPVEVTRITEKIEVNFQYWVYKNKTFYYLARTGSSSNKIYSFNPDTDNLSVYYSSKIPFNYFDIHNDIIVTADIKEFTGDIYLLDFLKR